VSLPFTMVWRLVSVPGNLRFGPDAANLNSAKQLQRRAIAPPWDILCHRIKPQTWALPQLDCAASASDLTSSCR